MRTINKDYIHTGYYNLLFELFYDNLKLSNEGFGNYIESLINNFVQNTNELSIDRLDNNALEERKKN